MKLSFFCVITNKIMISFENSNFANDGKYPSIAEIECSSYQISNRLALLEALRKINYIEGDLSFVTDPTYLKFVGYANDANASKEELSQYIEEINAYINQLG